MLSAVTTNHSTLNNTAVPMDCQEDAALLHLIKVEGGSTRRMQTVSAAHSNCVSTCYAARIWAKCAARRLQLITPKHSTACSFILYSLTFSDYIYAYVIYLCCSYPFEASQNLILLSEQNVPAINRSAGALSLAGGEP